ncbi:DUF2252 family protein [Streptomyces sp. Ncost-T10-10d]|uniref:DUF2252 family protein n=1 Tax=Streptomyces sp. Ncost-T10-10d TaxID=1839774 RepID=UPI0035209338
MPGAGLLDVSPAVLPEGSPPGTSGPGPSGGAGAGFADVHDGRDPCSRGEPAGPDRPGGRSLPSDRRTLPADFRFVDMARKVVGVGGVGTHADPLGDGPPPALVQANGRTEIAARTQRGHHGRAPALC